MNPPQVGGNMTVVIDDDEYDRGVDENKFRVIGRPLMPKGDPKD